MALEYEVRSEYKSLPLGKLLEQPVDVFEGVGDTQAAFLSQYFGITTVRQLGNFPFFLWALAIQNLALQSGDIPNQSIDHIADGATEMRFSIRPTERGKNPQQLIMGPLSALDGLTPGQNLALYDAFRITNIIQLAHNRIMLEARIIEYLEKHDGMVDDTATREQIASILGADTFIPLSGEEAQQALAGDKQQEADGIRKMASELGEHMKGRIDALRDRASERAKAITAQDDKAGSTDGVGFRRESGATPDRMDSLRSIRERTESTRIQALGSRAEAQSAADRVAAIEASRHAGSTTSQTAAGDVPPAAGPGEESLQPPGMGTEDSGSLATDPGLTAFSHEGGEGDSEDEFGESGTLDSVAQDEAGFEVAEEKRFKPWMAAAAVVLIVLIVAIWMISGGDDTEELVAEQGPAQEAATAAGTATEETTAQEGGEATQGTQGSQGTQGTQGTQESAATVAADQQAAVAAAQPPAPPSTIHSVSEGESLWRISRRYYRRGSLWPEIYDVNKEQIEDPDLIYPKQEFGIPER